MAHLQHALSNVNLKLKTAGIGETTRIIDRHVYAIVEADEAEQYTWLTDPWKAGGCSVENRPQKAKNAVTFL